jgi:hypothetical protein
MLGACTKSAARTEVDIRSRLEELRLNAELPSPTMSVLEMGLRAENFSRRFVPEVSVEMNSGKENGLSGSGRDLVKQLILGFWQKFRAAKLKLDGVTVSVDKDLQAANASFLVVASSPEGQTLHSGAFSVRFVYREKEWQILSVAEAKTNAAID